MIVWASHYSSEVSAKLQIDAVCRKSCAVNFVCPQAHFVPKQTRMIDCGPQASWWFNFAEIFSWRKLDQRT
jgi:hypothetical protein